MVQGKGHTGGPETPYDTVQPATAVYGHRVAMDRGGIGDTFVPQLNNLGCNPSRSTNPGACIAQSKGVYFQVVQYLPSHSLHLVSS